MRMLVASIVFFLTTTSQTLSVPADSLSAADSLRDLSRKVDILTEEFERLRHGDTGNLVDAGSGGLGPAAGAVYKKATSGVSIAGYGEMVYENYNTTRDDGIASGKQDQIDFLRAVVYFGYRYNDWILFNSEIEFEHGSTGSGGEVSVEFAYIELMPATFANIRAGMLLTPVGIVNEKHEPTTFFGTLRPQVERNIIPTTWRGNGAGLYGLIVPGLGYTAYVMEGLDASGFSASGGIRGGRQKGARAIAEDFGFAGRLEYNGLHGLTIGGSIFTGAAGQGATDSLGTICANTTVASIHGELAWRGLELRALYAFNAVADAGRLSVLTGETIGARMHGWYVVCGYDIIPLIDPACGYSLAPYIQYERFNTQAEVASGFTASPANDRSSVTVGLMYKPHPNVAFKGDFQDNRNEAGTGIDQWNLAVNYLF